MQQFCESHALQQKISSLTTVTAPNNPHHNTNDTSCFRDNIAKSLSPNDKCSRFADVIFEIHDRDADSEAPPVRIHGIRALFAMHSSVFADLLYPDNAMTNQ